MGNVLARTLLLLLALLMLGAAPCDDGGDGEGDGEGASEAEGSSGGTGAATTDGNTNSGDPGSGGEDGAGSGEDGAGTGEDGAGTGDGPGESGATDGGDRGEGAAEGAGEGGETGGSGGSGGEGDPGGGETDGDTRPAEAACDLRCEAGTHCELVEVQCVRAPCPPSPTCVESPRCGGFAGFTCPGAGECTDDPRDDCDPQNGGADCGGICECRTIARCQDGTVWNGSPAVCDCERVAAEGGDGGDSAGEGDCGGNTCGSDEYCCNPSCGICAPMGGFCTQQFCG